MRAVENMFSRRREYNNYTIPLWSALLKYFKSLSPVKASAPIFLSPVPSSAILYGRVYDNEIISLPYVM